VTIFSKRTFPSIDVNMTQIIVNTAVDDYPDRSKFAIIQCVVPSGPGLGDMKRSVLGSLAVHSGPASIARGDAGPLEKQAIGRLEIDVRFAPVASTERRRPRARPAGGLERLDDLGPTSKQHGPIAGPRATRRSAARAPKCAASRADGGRQNARERAAPAGVNGANAPVRGSATSAGMQSATKTGERDVAALGDEPVDAQAGDVGRRVAGAHAREVGAVHLRRDIERGAARVGAMPPGSRDARGGVAHLPPTLMRIVGRERSCAPRAS